MWPQSVYDLTWQVLPLCARDAFSGRLTGLYGHETDEQSFNSLTEDKKQALLIIASRLIELNLWQAVRQIENVYGRGGVGMNFTAWPLLASILKRRKDFTTRFAAHRDSSGGFFERRLRASLHFLYVDNGERCWSMHFDLYGPVASPVSFCQHLFYEKVRGITPDWRDIKPLLLDSRDFNALVS